MADNPQETARELQALVVDYAKQETIEPLKTLGRFAGFGLAAALLIGTGIVFVEIGILRLLTDQTGTAFTGNFSWVPYAIVVVASILVAVGAWSARSRRQS
ncbi:MAG: hypothetical protein ACKOBG_09745 [Actinomycetota bacterium]